MNFNYGILNQNKPYFMQIGDIVNICQSTIKIIFADGKRDFLLNFLGIIQHLNV